MYQPPIKKFSNKEWRWHKIQNSDILRIQSFHCFCRLTIENKYWNISWKITDYYFTSSAGCILYFPVINISSSNIRYLPLKSKPPISTHEISHQASISQNAAIYHGFCLQLCYWRFSEGELAKEAGFSFNFFPKLISMYNMLAAKKV